MAEDAGLAAAVTRARELEEVDGAFVGCPLLRLDALDPVTGDVAAPRGLCRHPCDSPHEPQAPK